MTEASVVTNLDNVCRFCLASNEYDLSPITKDMELSYNKNYTTNLDHIILVSLTIISFLYHP